MALAWEEALKALKPLAVQASKLQNQAQLEHDAALNRWKQSEKPVLKDAAAGYKNTLQILMQEEAKLCARIAALSHTAVANHPGTVTGFNVIRSRTDAEGQPLSTDDLRVERDRLVKARDAMEIQIAEAKAEITRHGRANEEEIWETKLVALQDTKRVYRDEINFLEVELLGREQHERIERERQEAEESGSAELRRVQEHFLQTRAKFNRAKQQFYFPTLKGYNITFGGGGIYGACKDIVICEINGALKLTAEPGEKRPDGTIKPARLIVTFEAATGTDPSTATTGGGGGDGSSSRRPNKSTTMPRPGSSSGRGGSGSDTAARSASAPILSIPKSPRPTQLPTTTTATATGAVNGTSETQKSPRPSGTTRRSVTFSGPSSQQPQPQLSPRQSQQQQPSQPASARTIPTHTTPSLTPTAASPAASPFKQQPSQSPHATSSITSSSSTQYQQHQQRQHQQHVESDSFPAYQQTQQSKGKTFASKFLKRLGNKKDKFQGRPPPHLQPAEDNDQDIGAPASKQQKRSLASKLLSRKSIRRSGSSGGFDISQSGGNRQSLEERGLPGFGGAGGGVNGSFLGESVDDSISTAQRSDDDDDDDDGVVNTRATHLKLSPREMAAIDEYGGNGSIDHHKAERLLGVHQMGEPLPSRVTEGEEESDNDDDDVDSSSDTDSDIIDSGIDTLGNGMNGMSLHEAAMPSPLTKEALQQATAQQQYSYGGSGSSLLDGGHRSSERGSWLRANNQAAAASGSGIIDGASVLDEGSSSIVDLVDAATEVVDGELAGCIGVFVTGRLKGFDLVGERGTKVPNLTIREADVTATVFVKFVFEYTPTTGWRCGVQPGDKPRFHVENLSYKIRGNNVPMPPTLIKHILRVAIPGLIQRKLMALLPKEFGDYLLTSQCGFSLTTDVGLTGPSLAVLDADLGFEVQGPAPSADGAKTQQKMYEAAKKARALLGLSLPQAQILAEIFNGHGALLDPPRPVSISELINFQARFEKHPVVYKQLCSVIDRAYQTLASGRNIADFSFPKFLSTAIARMREKPARARVVMQDANINLNVDAILTAIHDFTQRTFDDMVIKGPLNDPRTNLDEMRAAVEEELVVLHAWHAFALRELGHFKSKFRGSQATVLAGADKYGFSAGIEGAFYEGPLRLRLPVAMKLDQDGAFSFEAPLPSPEGNLGKFVDGFKALTVPSHVRPPAGAVNWIEITGDPVLEGRMQGQLRRALELIQGVLDELTEKVVRENLRLDDADPEKALSFPRTAVGEKLGRFIVNRLKVRVRLDERRIGEILSGLDPQSMGADAFNSTAGRIIGHLGDVMTMAFTPAAAEVEAGSSAAPPPCSDRYLFQLESSDVSRLRADVQSLGFQSAITPGGAVRLVHAIIRSAMYAFKERPESELVAYREKMQLWYRELTREALDVSVSLDTKGEVQQSDGAFVVSLVGTADEAHLRATSPLMMRNDIDLVKLGKAMRGDPPPANSEQLQAQQ